jgi:ATP-dependent DNA ligase
MKRKEVIFNEAQAKGLIVSINMTKEEIMDQLAIANARETIGPNGVRPPLDQYHIMLAKPIMDLKESEFEHVIHSTEHVAEIKYDGCRCKWHIGEGENRLDSRHRATSDYRFHEVSDNFPHLRDCRLDRLAGTIFDGEILMDVPGITLNKTRTKGTLTSTVAVFNSLPERAVEIQRAAGWAKFVIFDILKLCGQDMRVFSFAERRQAIIQILLQATEDGRQIGEPLQPFNTLVQASQIFRLNDSRNAFDLHTDSFAAVYALALANKCEGAMIKSLRWPYQPDKRTKAMYKWKEADTISGFIAGSRPGTGKNETLFGSLVIHVFDAQGNQHELCSVIPGTDAMRLQLAGPDGLVSDAYVGQVVDLTFQQWTKFKKLRHAVIAKWRPDLSMHDCKLPLEIDESAQNMVDNRY